MKKYALALVCIAFTGYGSLAFAAEDTVVLDEVPEAVKAMNALPPEEQKQQAKAEKDAAASFDAAAESTAQKKPS